MAKSNSRRNVGLFFAAPLMAGGLLVTMFAVRPWHERLLIDYWQEKVDRLPDDGMRATFDELAERGDLGIRILASQVGSEREAVSRAAYEALRDTISGWREDALSRPLAHLRLIAEVLAGSADRYGPASRDRAAAIVRQILLWMPPDEGGDREELIAHCQTVIQLAGTDTGSDRLAASPGDRPDWRLRQPLLAATDRMGGRVEFPTEVRTDRQVALAGHRTALASQAAALAEPPVPTPLEWPNAAAHSGAAANPGGRMVMDVVAQPAAADLSPHDSGPGSAAPLPAPAVLTGPPEAQPIPRPAAREAVGDGGGAALAAAADASGRASEAEQTASDLTRLPVIRVMSLLHDPLPDTVAAAAAELDDRGLSGQHLELARDLTDPDPAVRRRLVDRLPDTPGLVARPWLLWLSHDDDADVRLAALTFLATSSDPRLLDYVRQLADRDQDPRIEVLGTRLGQRELR
jgi:hypothetical protein